MQHGKRQHGAIYCLRLVAECGLSDITGKQANHPRKFSVLAQEATVAVTIRKDTFDRATAYMGAKTNSVFARQDVHDEGTALATYLSHFPFMEQLSTLNQKRVLDECRERKLRKLEPLLAPGASTFDMVIVLSGCLGSYRLERSVTTTTSLVGTAKTKQYGTQIGQVTSGECYGDLNIASGLAVDCREDGIATFTSSLIAEETTEVVLVDRRQVARLLTDQVPTTDFDVLVSKPPLERSWSQVGEIRQWLLKFFVFQQFPDRVITRLAETALGTALIPNKVIFNKSSDADAFYFVMAGAVTIQECPSNGTILPGDIFGIEEIQLKRKRQRIASATSDAFLVKFPKAVYWECIHCLASDIVWTPATRLLSMQKDSTLSTDEINDVAKLLRNLRVFAHVPLTLLVEIVPYMTVQTLSSGDVVCMEDTPCDTFVALLAGHVSCHSRDHTNEALGIFHDHAFVRVPSMQEETVFPSPLHAAAEKKFAALYGNVIHVLHARDVCRTGVFDTSTGMRRYHVTLVALTPSTTILTISDHNLTYVVERLVPWSTAKEDSLKAWIEQGERNAAASFGQDDMLELLKHFRFPFPWPLEKAALHLSCVKLQPGDVVVRAGEVLRHLVVVLKGHLVISVVQPRLNAAPIVHAMHANAFAKLLTSNFQSTSKTLASLRDARRLSTVLPSIAKMSRSTPWWQKRASATMAPPDTGRRRSSALRSLMENQPAEGTHDHGDPQHAHGHPDKSPTKPLVTFMAGDVWGAELVFARSWTSLHDVVAETPTEVLLIPRDVLVELRLEELAAATKKNEIQAKRILAKAHWKRANNKVVEKMLSSSAAANAKPKFWRLLDQAASQRVKLIIKHLSGMELFQSMSDATISSIVASARYDTVEKGDVIYKAGDAPKRYHVVVSGAIGLYSAYPHLQDECLHVIHDSGGFGEFEILTKQLSRSLSAVAEDSTKLISFAAPSFLELWDAAKLDQMRAEVAFFQQLHWTRRLEMDKLAHIYHSAQALSYPKGGQIVQLHATLNHCFIIKQGSCFMGNIFDLEATNGLTDQVETMHVTTNLAHMCKGQTLWVLGRAEFSLTAAEPETIVCCISLDLLKQVLPKHFLARLERQIEQYAEYHAAQSNALKERAIAVLNARAQVYSSGGGGADSDMFLPPFDHGKHEMTLTDVVAATPLSLTHIQTNQELESAPLHEVRPPTTATTTSSLPLSAPSTMFGSFWRGRRLARLKKVKPIVDKPAARPSSRSEALAASIAPAPPRPLTPPSFFTTELPESHLVVAMGQFYLERYDVNSPFRTLRLEALPKTPTSATTAVAPAQTPPQVLLYHLDKDPPPTPDEGRRGNIATPGRKLVKRPTNVSNIVLDPSINHQANREKMRKVPFKQRKHSVLAAPKGTPPSEVHKTGKLAIRVVGSHNHRRQSHEHMVAVLHGSSLRLYLHEHDVNQRDMTQHEWNLTKSVQITEWPEDAQSPCDFLIHFDDNSIVWFTAVSMEEKAKWVAMLHRACHRDEHDASSTKLSMQQSRILPSQPRLQTTVMEVDLPEISYVVDLEH
ncbi:unnamed protein product [Aphanomyces euteiches]